MSYILDALKKADHESSIGDVPDLDAPHWTQRRSGPVRPWVWVVIGLLVVNGALLAVLFSRDDRSDSEIVVSSQVPDPQQGISRGAPAQLSQERQHATITNMQQPDSLPLQPLVRPERKVMTRPRQAAPPAVEDSQESKRAVIADSRRVTPAAAKAVQADASRIPEWNE
ncbi:MAG: hypothetical protein WBN90_09490, partial [Gammaproteobacteria bacterium]